MIFLFGVQSYFTVHGFYFLFQFGGVKPFCRGRFHKISFCLSKKEKKFM